MVRHDWQRIGTAATLAFLLIGFVPAATAAAPAAIAGADAGTAADPQVLRTWARTCALCHVNGSGGAPRAGHPEEWRMRIAQGREVLLSHTVEGIGNMPPLGYCMACERADFIALIELMAGALPAPAGDDAP